MIAFMRLKSNLLICLICFSVSLVISCRTELEIEEKENVIVVIEQELSQEVSADSVWQATLEKAVRIIFEDPTLEMTDPRLNDEQIQRLVIDAEDGLTLWHFCTTKSEWDLYRGKRGFVTLRDDKVSCMVVFELN